MRGSGIVFTAPEQAELEDIQIETSDLRAGEALVQAEYSLVSAGTEGSFYTNLMGSVPDVYYAQQGRPASIYPARTGYGHLGRVVALGPGTAEPVVGTRILTFSRHASLVRANVARFFLPVSGDIAGQRAVFTRLAGVAITALRASSCSAGECVAIIGLGLVGNLAAQIFQLAGAEVIAFDPAEHRVALARTCGVHDARNLSGDGALAAVREWSHGPGARIVVEAVGRSDLVQLATEMTAPYGEVILLGSPRAPYTAEITSTFARIHLRAIKLIGALEWTFPLHGVERAQHTIRRNYDVLLDWIERGKLIVDPLCTHVLSPEHCQEAYHGLIHEKDAFLGVVFDWTGVPMLP
ncbi:MAG: zinc-binding alcohol dehydrogenase [Chloroflexi bacterium]|nr:zinc-binding alcohol dehydrogenase [Chloroflexota bacterium]